MIDTKISSTFLNGVRRNPNLTAAVIFIFSLFICFTDLFLGEAALKWDAFRLWYPWKHFITNELLNGDLPLWNPFHLGGFPQQSDSMTWYPISWILGFLTGGYKLITLNIEYLLHLFLAGFGCYKLMRFLKVNWQLAVLLGLSYMLSGFMLGNAQHLGWIVSAAWLPWLALTLIQLMNQPGWINMLRLSLVGFLFFSGGYLALFFISLYFIIGYLIYELIKDSTYRWKKLTYAIGSVLIIALLSAPILYSFYDLAPILDRASPASMGDQFDLNYGATPLNGLLATVLPFSSGIFNVFEIEFGTFSTFLGTIPLLLIAVRFKRLICDRKLLGVFLLSLLLMTISLGDLTPLRDWISYFPLMDLFRYPTIFRLFSILLILIVVGCLFREDKVLDEFISRIRESNYLIITGIGILLIALVVIFFNWGEGIFTLHFFSNPGLHLQSLNIEDRIIFSLVTTLVMISTLILGIRLFKQRGRSLLNMIWVVELFVVASISTVNVVNEPVSVESADKRLAQQPYSFKYVVDNISQEENRWVNYLDYAWEGKPILLKQPSTLGFSPIKLKSNEFPSRKLVTPGNIGFLSVVDGSDNSLVQKSANFRVKGTSNWIIQPKDYLTPDEYYLIKQNKTPGWIVVCPELSEVELDSTKEGYFLLHADQPIEIEYSNTIYWVVFLLHLFALLIVILMLSILSVRGKIRWYIVSLFVIVLAVILFQNRSRWFANEVPKITLGKITSGQDHSALEEYLLNCRLDEVYVMRNTPKTDRFLDELNYYFDRSEEYSTGTLFTKYEREGKVRTPLFSLSGDAFKSDGYQIDIGRLKREGKINNRIYISLRFRQLQDSDIQLWLNHSKNGEWINGKAWDISESISLNKENKLLIRSIDLNKYQITDNSSLKLYLSSDEALNGLEVQELRLEHYD